MPTGARIMEAIHHRWRPAAPPGAAPTGPAGRIPAVPLRWDRHQDGRDPVSGTFHDEHTTADPQTVTDLFAGLGVRFAFDTAGPELPYRESRAGDEDLSVARLTMGQGFSTWGDTEVFGVADVHGPRYDWHTGDEDGTVGAPVLFRPGHPALVVAGPLAATNVYVSPARLQEVAETVYDTGEPVAFGSSSPTSARLGGLWSSLVRTAVSAVDSGTFAEPLVRADLSRHLAVGLLECFPLLGDSHERTLSMAAQARRYRIARQFLDDHAHLPVTVEDAARAAGTTTPALVRAFRANHAAGTTPAAYLRRARLAGAHAELLAADPARGDTVRAVAARWGFAHPGRFARAYREAYGVAPSATLRR